MSTSISSELAKRIELLAFDVDGVMTSGEITYTSSGDELKTFNAKDGMGFTLAKRAGLKLAIVTARESAIVQRRAEELGVDIILQATKDKRKGVDKVCDELGLKPAQLAYMGDDIPDLSALTYVGLPACPADAAEEVKQASHFISTKNGGQGAIREFVTILLKARGH